MFLNISFFKCKIIAVAMYLFYTWDILYLTLLKRVWGKNWKDFWMLSFFPVEWYYLTHCHNLWDILALLILIWTLFTPSFLTAVGNNWHLYASPTLATHTTGESSLLWPWTSRGFLYGRQCLIMNQAPKGSTSNCLGHYQSQNIGSTQGAPCRTCGPWASLHGPFWQNK